MVKPNYAFAKRQRDLKKQRKRQEKQERKTAGKLDPTAEAQDETTREEPQVVSVDTDAKDLPSP